MNRRSEGELMWQKAQVIVHPLLQFKHLTGRTVWVRGHPYSEPHYNLLEPGSILFVPSYDTNLTVEGCNRPVCMEADILELLGEFAEEVPLIPWEKWLK